MRLAGVALLASLATCAVALGAGYGTGTFKGQVKADFGDRSKTRVVVKVIPGKARVKKVVLDLNCGSDPSLPARVKVGASGPYTRVKPGPAGGGAIARLKGQTTIRGTTYKVGGDVHLGLRSDRVFGNVSGYLKRGGSFVCTDDSGIFTAKR